MFNQVYDESSLYFQVTCLKWERKKTYVSSQISNNVTEKK